MTSSSPITVTRQAQLGIGIIEVLVALVVVSLGVLGMASLQLTGMKHSTGGYNRSKALMYAENMATRMRINAPAVRGKAYAGFDSSTLNCAVQPAQYCQESVGTKAAMCTSDQLASFDLFSVACGDWGSEGATEGVNGSLRGGKLLVECADADCEPESTYTITVSWVEGLSNNRTNDTAKLDETQTRRVQMRLRP